MKYILIIAITLMINSCINQPADHVENITACEEAYEFEYSTNAQFPVACYTINNKECCSWKLRSGTHMEMCLDEVCIWKVSKNFRGPPTPS